MNLRTRKIRMAIAEQLRVGALDNGRAFLTVREFASRQYGVKNISDHELSANMYKKNGKMVLNFDGISFR